MVEFITGNETEIEEKINKALKKLPNAFVLGTVVPYATGRGIMFGALISYGEEQSGGVNNPMTKVGGL